MGLEEALTSLPPGFLSFCRTRFTLPFNEILRSLPEQGTLLDVGCGTGMVVWEIARRRPGLEILGIDLKPGSIRLAQRWHARPNVRFFCLDLEEVEGNFDCISFVDVFHHVPDSGKGTLLAKAQKHLKSQGYILVKETSSSHEDLAFCLDRCLGRDEKLWFAGPDGFAKFLPPGLEVRRNVSGYRFPFAHYLIVLSPTS